jgi:septation ring formation regulator EzrA
MTDTEFQQLVLGKLTNIETDVSVLKSDVSVLKSDVSVLKSNFSTMQSNVSSLQAGQSRLEDKLDSFRENQDGYNDALWKLSNQAFHDISDIKAEMIPAWKSAL